MWQVITEPRLDYLDYRVFELGILFDEQTHMLGNLDLGFHRFEGRLDKVEHRLDQTMNMVGDLSNSMDRQFNEVNRRLDGIDQRLDRMDTRFDGIDQRLDRMDQRFDRIEALLVDLVGRRPQSPSSN